MFPSDGAVDIVFMMGIPGPSEADLEMAGVEQGGVTGRCEIGAIAEQIGFVETKSFAEREQGQMEIEVRRSLALGYDVDAGEGVAQQFHQRPLALKCELPAKALHPRQEPAEHDRVAKALLEVDEQMFVGDRLVIPVGLDGIMFTRAGEKPVAVINPALLELSLQ